MSVDRRFLRFARIFVLSPLPPSVFLSRPLIPSPSSLHFFSLSMNLALCSVVLLALAFFLFFILSAYQRAAIAQCFQLDENSN